MSSYGYKLSNGLEVHDSNPKITFAKKSTLCKDSLDSFICT